MRIPSKLLNLALDNTPDGLPLEHTPHYCGQLMSDFIHWLETERPAEMREISEAFVSQPKVQKALSRYARGEL